MKNKLKRGCGTCYYNNFSSSASPCQFCFGNYDHWLPDENAHDKHTSVKPTPKFKQPECEVWL